MRPPAIRLGILPSAPRVRNAALLALLTLCLGVIPVSAAAGLSVVAWGLNSEGQTDVPVALGGVTAIAASARQSVALLDDGTVVNWGVKGPGISTVPAGLTGVKALAVGDSHVVALKEDGTVVAWGSNYHGESSVPAGLSGVKAISVSRYYNVALKEDGTVVAWGVNFSRQPTAPAGLTDVKVIATGPYHTLALKTDGTVVAWGQNLNGQSTVPAGLTGVKAVTAGYYHSVGLKQDGTVVAWGRNTDGQSTVPTDLSGVKEVVAGVFHSVALKQDGTVVAWGDSSYRQSTVPTGLSGVEGLVAGVYSTVALKEDGTLVAWGSNGAGGPSVVLAGLTGVVAVAVALNHTVAAYRPTPHRAAGTAQRVNGFVVDITISDHGYGYSSAPAVRIEGGGGTGAIATAVVSNGVVLAINIVEAGIGYTSLPTVRIAAPNRPPELRIRITQIALDLKLKEGDHYQLLSSEDLDTWTPLGAAFLSDSDRVTKDFELWGARLFFRILEANPTSLAQVSGASVENAVEFDWMSASTSAQLRPASLSTPRIHRATGVPVVVNRFVVGVTITDGGFGYIAPPEVRIVGGGGIGAKASARVDSGVVTEIIVENAGRGYVGTPTVQIAEPPFTPELAIRIRKMAVDLKLTLGNRYQLFSSLDQVVWVPLGTPFTASEEQITLEFDPAVTGPFFRISQI